MNDPVASWSTFALAISSFMALGIAYWGIKKQTESLEKSVSADICLKLMDRFDRPSMIAARSEAAKALLSKTNLDSVDEVFDFFESVGLYVRREMLDKEVAHSFFFHWINLYWNAGKERIETNRLRAAGIYSDFESLYQTVLAIEMKEDPKSRDINPTDADLKAFLKQEIVTLNTAKVTAGRMEE